MPTLLIADDQEGVLAALDFILSEHGARVLLAKSGPIALQLFESESVDVALIDLHMPGMDGLAVSRRLRERAAAKSQNLPIWMMTAAYTAAAVTAAKQAGAITLLKKPFDTVELLREMELAVTGQLPVPPFTPNAPSQQTDSGQPASAA
jgi:CheY-like chemotaxis protein